MNITLDKNSPTDGLIKIKLTESDYQPKVEEKVREYARKANIKGFRQGKVPNTVIRRMFGKSILVEEVNHLISHSVSDYIKDQNLRILGDPLPNQEKSLTIDWDNQKDFEFEFQIGLVEDFTYDLSSKVKLKSHPIKVDQKTIDETLEDLKTRFGEVSYPESSEAGDNIFGDIQESGQEEKKGGYLPLSKVNPKALGQFLGLKKEDRVEFEIKDLFSDTEEKARFLGVTPEQAKEVKGTYSLSINNISRVRPAEINQDLFDKVFGKDSVTTEEGFISKIRETIAANYQRETDHLLEHEIQHYYVDHTKINMPDSFLKAWLKRTSDGKVTDEIIEKEFNEYRDSLKWDLIKNRIAEDHKISVEATEVKEKAKQLIMDQFGGPAIAEQLGDRMDAIADNYLSDQEGKNFMQIYNQLRQEKIFQFIRSTITVEEKPVTLEAFKELAEKHNH